MAQYPINLPQLIGTTFSGSDGIEVERSISGRPRIRNYYSQTWREGEIIHELSDAQLLILNNFYTANKAIPFIFTFQADDVDYNCNFSSSPIAVPILGGFYDVQVSIIQVA